MVVFLPDLEIQSYFAVTELAIHSFSGSSSRTSTYLIPLVNRPSVPFATALHVLDLVQARTRHAKHLSSVSDRSPLAQELVGSLRR
jgi:hypothetical protein